MKKFIHKLICVMLMAVLAAVILGGCSSGEETVRLPEMGEIHLQTTEPLGDEYATGMCIVVQESCDDTHLEEQYDGVDDELMRFPVEIKLRGNSSRESAKKAYTLKFETEWALLGMEAGRKWALVSNPFDKSLLRPAVGFALADALGLEYVSQTRICKVWVDNTYMGIYTAMEPVEAGDGRVEIDADADGGAKCDFLLERNLGRYEDDKVYIDSSLGMRFEFNDPDEPDNMQLAECYGLLAAAEEAICSGDHEKYEQLIDVESFVNFYVFQEVIKDVDFGEYSTRYYFKDGVLYAGPPWDLDLTMGNVSAEKEEFKYAAYNNVEGAAVFGGSAYGLWAVAGDYYYWLCRDSWFMELVHQRWQAVRPVVENLAVDNELGENLIDRYLAEYLPDLESNFEECGSQADGETVSAHGSVGRDTCWTVNEPAHMSEWQEPAETYIENVEMLRLWLIKRVAYLDSQFGPFVYTPALAVQ